MNGVLYVAVGLKWMLEAEDSARSLKQHMPDLPVTLFAVGEVRGGPFDAVETMPRPPDPKAAKIACLARTPYDRTLFLDTDTRVMAGVGELFDLLDRFDIAAAHAPVRATVDLPGVPACFPEFNTGVVAFRRSPAVLAFLEDWGRRYGSHAGRRFYDQPAFREVIYGSGLRVATLTPEYNCRPDAGYAWGEVKIVHARGEVLERAKGLNAGTGPRVYREGAVV